MSRGDGRKRPLGGQAEPVPKQGLGFFASALEILEVAGSDALRFLNGYLTCDLTKVAAGSSEFGFFTSREGRILGEADCLEHGGGILALVPPHRGAVLAAHLRQFVLGDRVEVAERPELGALLVLGARAEAAAEALVARLGMARRDFGATPVLRVVVPRELLPQCEAALLSRSGAVRLAEEEVELARVEAGVPAWGREFDEDHLPPETGLEALAVSYTKGCYLGQEIVARVHWRGQAPRGLRGLWFAPEAVPTSGAAVRYLGEPVGRLGTVAHSPRLGPIALAILHRRVPLLGVSVEVDGGGPAAVVELPFG